MVDPEAWSALMDLWLVVPFTLGFIFFRSKAGVVIEEYCLKTLYGDALGNKGGPDVDTDHLFAVRSELRQIRQEIINERSFRPSTLEAGGNSWHEE